MIEIIPNWHPVWVHFPIALLVIAGVMFWLASSLRGRLGHDLTLVARWNLGLGVLFLAPTLLTGYLAYQTVPHDSAGHEAMHRHLIAAWIATGLFVVSAWLAWREREAYRGASWPLRMLLLAGVVAISVTGYLGAENVYRHGIGVERLPETGDHGHGEVGGETGHHDHHH
ncbi:MAG: DUF2231 domain-containing protein [Halomonadaceae bacterium]|nr:MAG: DUF2231 domain-containing protein [Halomonadaceae bacterium]